MSIFDLIKQFIVAAMTCVFILDALMLFFGWRLWKHRQARKARRAMSQPIGEIVGVENTSEGVIAQIKLSSEGIRMFENMKPERERTAR